MKKLARPAILRPVGSSPCSLMRRAIAESVVEFDVEHRLGVGLVAGLRVVAGQDQQVVHPGRRRAHQIGLQRNAIAVAAGELQDRLDAVLHHERRCNGGGQVRAGARPVGDVDRVRQALERQRLRQHVLRVERNGRRDLGGDHELARAQECFKARSWRSRRGRGVHFWSG